MRISESVFIRSDPHAVFEWIADPNLASRWQPEVVEWEIIRSTSDMVGTEFREVVGDRSGSVELYGRIVTFVPDERVEFDISGPRIRVRARYAVSRVMGGAKVRVDTDLRVGGALARLADPFLRRKASRQVRSELELLRGFCETDRPLTG